MADRSVDLERIVVPLDGSKFAQRALVPARLLAAGLGVPVELLAVRYGEALEEIADELRDAAAAAGIEQPSLVIIRDEPVSAVGAMVESIKPGSVVCMATHARHGVALGVLGSVAQDVLRRVHVPFVLVGPKVHPEALQPVHEVVTCVDGLPDSHDIVTVAAALARPLRAELHVIEVAHTDPAVRARQLMEGEILDRPALAAVASGTGVPARCSFVQSSDVAAAIVDAADDPASLVAMVTHARGGFARFVLGSTTMAVVARATVPVLVLRPPEPLES